MEKDEKGGKFKSIATAIGLEALTAFSGYRAPEPEPPQPVEAVLQDEDSEVVTAADGKLITEEEQRRSALEQAQQEENDLAGALEHSRSKELERRKEEWEEGNNGEDPLEDSPDNGNHRTLPDSTSEDAPESTDDEKEMETDSEDFLTDIEEWEDPVETDELTDEFNDDELEELEMINIEPEIDDIWEGALDESAEFEDDYGMDAKEESELEAADGDRVYDEVNELEENNADLGDIVDFNIDTVESDDQENTEP